MSKKMTSQRVKQSMLSMLLGRPLSAVSGFAILILLSRALPAVDYGLYFSVWAIAEIVILASNFGLLHAAYRDISADEAHDGRLTLHGPLWQLTGCRVLSLLPAAALILLLPEMFGGLGRVALDLLLALALALVIIGEGLARYIEALFDSMLCQGRGQITLLCRTLARLVGYSLCWMQGPLDLHQVLIVESIATLAGAGLGLFLLWRLWLAAHVASPVRFRLRDMLGFALPAYVAQVLTLTYGPDALKLILAGVAGPEALALFGFAFALAAVIQRYIPVNLLAGVFRPVFVTAAKRADADNVLATLIGMTVKLSWLMILPLLCFSWCGGSSALAAISGGNYTNAGPVVSTVVGGLLLISLHLTFSMYCVALGLSWPMLGATIFSVSSIPLAIWLARHYGALGIAGSFTLSELIWTACCYLLLWRTSGRPISLDWGGLGRLLGATALAILVGEGLSLAGVHWLVLGSVSALLCLGLVWPLAPFSALELGWLASVVPGGQRLQARWSRADTTTSS